MMMPDTLSSRVANMAHQNSSNLFHIKKLNEVSSRHQRNLTAVDYFTMSEQPRQQMSKFVHKLTDERESPRNKKVPVKKAIENLKYFVGARRLMIPRSPQSFKVLKRKRELSHQVSNKAMVKRPRKRSGNLPDECSFLEQPSRISNGVSTMEEHSTNQETEDVPLAAYTSEEVARKHRFRSEERYVNEHMECELAAYKEEIEKRFEASTINKGYAFPRGSALP